GAVKRSFVLAGAAYPFGTTERIRTDTSRPIGLRPLGRLSTALEGASCPRPGSARPYRRSVVPGPPPGPAGERGAVPAPPAWSPGRWGEDAPAEGCLVPRPGSDHDRPDPRPGLEEVTMRRSTRLALACLLAVGLAVSATTAWTQAKPPIKVALVAALSGGSALSGEAIKRGLTVAIDEVNARGGLLGGCKVELVTRDEEGNPAKGVTAAGEAMEREHVVAVFGGLHSPVGLAMLPVFHELRVPYVGTWAAATNITRNGRSPNFMFRVSANDDLVDRFLVKHVTQVLKAQKPGIILENTPWGASNQEGLTKWLGQAGLQPAGVEKFNWNDPDMSPQLLRLRSGGADALIMVANAPEGAQVVKSKAKIAWSAPTVSHWGISGGRFAEL